VNDYQFALIPNLLKHSVNTFVFWHIPWPKNVLPQHVHAMVELAVGLLHARVVGFHTNEYLENFFEFVEDHLPHVEVHARERIITLPDQIMRDSHKTRFLVAPLGINAVHWNDMARLGSLNQEVRWPRSLPCILSIDRADYTKGVHERIEAIECFFSNHPEWQQKVSFLQLGTRSRQGLYEFDRYWNECQHLCAALNSRFRTSDWQPLIWTRPSWRCMRLTRYTAFEVSLKHTLWRNHEWRFLLLRLRRK
jgi:trehalose 6-phosphate synthase